MPWKSSEPGVEIDPGEVQDISEARKQHYLAEGLKPYRMRTGRVKWFNSEQHHYKQMRGVGRRRLFKPKKKYSGHRRRSSPAKQVLRFVVEHWGYLVMIISVVLLVIYSSPLIELLRKVL